MPTTHIGSVAPEALHQAIMNASTMLGQRFSPQGRAQNALLQQPGQWVNEDTGNLLQGTPWGVRRRFNQGDYSVQQDTQGNYSAMIGGEGAAPGQERGLLGGLLADAFGNIQGTQDMSNAPVTREQAAAAKMAQQQQQQQNAPQGFDIQMMLQQMFQNSIGQGQQQINPGFGGPLPDHNAQKQQFQHQSQQQQPQMPPHFQQLMDNRQRIVPNMMPDYSNPMAFMDQILQNAPQSPQIPYREEGGPVDKPSRKELQDFLSVLNADRGGIPVIAHPGEFVLNSDAVKMLGEDQLEDLNNQARSGLQHAFGGGSVGSNQTMQLAPAGQGGGAPPPDPTNTGDWLNSRPEARAEQERMVEIANAILRLNQLSEQGMPQRESDITDPAQVDALRWQAKGNSYRDEPAFQPNVVSGRDILNFLTTDMRGEAPTTEPIDAMTHAAPMAPEASQGPTQRPPHYHQLMANRQTGGAPSAPQPTPEPAPQGNGGTQQTAPTPDVKTGTSPKVPNKGMGKTPPATTPETAVSRGQELPQNVPLGSRVDIDWQALERMTPGEARDYLEGVARAESTAGIFDTLGLRPGQREREGNLLNQYRGITQEQGQQLSNIYATDTMDSRVQQQEQAARQGNLNNIVSALTLPATVDNAELTNEQLQQQLNQSEQSFGLRQDYLRAQINQMNAQEPGAGTSVVSTLNALGLDFGQLVQMGMQGNNYANLMYDRTLGGLQAAVNNENLPEEQREISQYTLYFLQNPQILQNTDPTAIDAAFLEQMGVDRGNRRTGWRANIDETTTRVQQAFYAAKQAQNTVNNTSNAVNNLLSSINGGQGGGQQMQQNPYEAANRMQQNTGVNLYTNGDG